MTTCYALVVQVLLDALLAGADLCAKGLFAALLLIALYWILFYKLQVGAQHARAHQTLQTDAS